MFFVTIFFILLIWYVIICYKWKKNIFDHLEKLPGPKWYPVLGTFYSFVGVSRADVLYKHVEIVDKYRPFFKSWKGHVGEVNLMKADHLQIIMRSPAHITKGQLYDYLFPWLGDGLFISEGAKWFLQRKLLTPTFHFKILDGFVDIFAKRTQSFVDELKGMANGEVFDVVPAATRCTLNIIFDAAMGVRLEEITDDPMCYRKNVHDITEMAMWRYWRPYINDTMFKLLPQGRRYKRALNGLHDFSSKVIDYKKEILRKRNQDIIDGKIIENSENCKSFLDILMESTNDKEIVSDQNLKDLVDSFILAGFESTASTVSWTLFLLGNNPDVQEKVFQEVRSVLGDKPSPTSIQQLNELKYLECVIAEALRLFPILPIITRRLKEDVQIDGYTIPRDTHVLLHIFQVQRDPEHFPDPNTFDPDRFLPENSKGRHPFAYIPFSAGPRNCLGIRFAKLELKAILSTVINKFKVTAVEKPEDIRLFVHVLLRSQNGINIKLECRN